MGTLAEFSGTTWAGIAELWLDPLGDEAVRSDCTIAVIANVVSYTWSHEGQGLEGSITLTEHGAEFVDTFHSPEPMKCRLLVGQGIFQVQGAYGADADWGWRIGLSHRARSDELVLQMTNIAPWGEEARAVRMICRRA